MLIESGSGTINTIPPIRTVGHRLLSQKHTLSAGIRRMSDKTVLSVSYVTPLGQPKSYFVRRADSELAPSAIRRKSVPPRQRPELECYGQNSASVARAASYPVRRAGSRDRSCMVRGLARRRCGIFVSQHTAICCEPLPDHTGDTERPAPTACRYRRLGESDMLFGALQLHAVVARAR